MLKGLYKPSASESSLAAYFSAATAAESPVVSPVARPASARPASAPTRGWKDLFNKMEGECRWPYPPPRAAETKDCAFSFTEAAVALEQNPAIKVVILPAGTKLYHATTIYPKKPTWFNTSNPYFTLTAKAMWFASSADHAKHMGYTHLLEYTLEQDARLLWIQNLKTTFGKYGVTNGKELMKNPLFQSYVKHHEPIVGYAGCNECEIAFFKEYLPTLLPTKPVVLETRSISFALGGGTRRRKHRHLSKSKRSSTRRSAKHVV